MNLCRIVASNGDDWWGVGRVPRRRICKRRGGGARRRICKARGGLAQQGGELVSGNACFGTVGFLGAEFLRVEPFYAGRTHERKLLGREAVGEAAAPTAPRDRDVPEGSRRLQSLVVGQSLGWSGGERG
jgi:hypothetical protein